METLINVGHGFGVALMPINLLYCFIGVFIGTLVGVLPGIGPISAMSLLLLLLRVVDPVRWTLAIPIGVLAPLGVWWVLKRLLLIQLPSGIFGIG